MPKCIDCGSPVTGEELKECERVGTYGVYCCDCLTKLCHPEGIVNIIKYTS